MRSEKKVVSALFAGIFIANILSAQTQFTISNSPCSHTLPALCKGDSSYLVCWVDDRAGSDTNRVYGQIISASGGLIENEFLINSTSTVLKPIIAFDPLNERFLVTDCEWARGFFVSENGSVIDSTDSLIPGDGTYPEAVCFDGNKYFIIFYCIYGANEYKLLGRFFSRAGKPIDTSIVINQLYGPVDINIVPNDSDYLVVWSDNRSGYSNIYGQLLSKQGLPLNSDFPISSEQWDESYPKVSSDNKNWLVVWEENSQIKGKKILSNGQLTDSETDIVSKEYAYLPSLSFDGEMYIAAVSTINAVNILTVTRPGETVTNQYFLQNGSVFWTDICAYSTGYLVVFSVKDTLSYNLLGIMTNVKVHTFPDTVTSLKILSNPFFESARVIGYKGELKIYDISGREVESMNVTDNQNTFGSKLKQGIYFLKPKNKPAVKAIKMK